MPETSRIRRAQRHDSEAVLDILGDAFETDPVMRWVTRQPSYPRYAFSLTVPFCLGQGLTYMTEEGSGVATWLPPGVALESPVSASVVWKGLTQYGPGSVLRAFATLLQTQRRHPKEDFYYLFAIGTRQAHRARGIGGALMRAGLERCDEQRMPAYLESSNERNLPFYRAHGFEIIDEIRLAMGGPPMSLMWRGPR